VCEPYTICRVPTGTESGRRRRRSDHRRGRHGEGQGTVPVRVGHPVVLRPVQHAHPVHVFRRVGLQHRVLGHQPVRSGHHQDRFGPGHPVLRHDHVHQPHDHARAHAAGRPGSGLHRQRGLPDDRHVRGRRFAGGPDHAGGHYHRRLVTVSVAVFTLRHSSGNQSPTIILLLL